MAIKARFVHTNLTSRDWKGLVQFYCNVFGCVPKGPERDFSGDWLQRVTGIAQPHVRGIHLRLPGYADRGPTLEIFTYESMPERNVPKANEPGFGHIAFAVDDVEEAVAAVLRAGGNTVGEMGFVDLDGVGSLQVVYARDPEGNIVELQKWTQPVERA